MPLDFDISDDQRRMSAQVDRLLRDVNDRASRALGTVSEIAFRNVQAVFETTLRLDPTEGPIIVDLPRADADDLNRWIRVVNVSSSRSAITLRPPPDTLINGEAAVVVSRPYSVREIRVIGEGSYVCTVVLNGSTSGSPLTTKGDLYSYASADERLPLGSDGYTQNGLVLTNASSASTGLQWRSPSWQYLPATQPSGAPVPAAVWQFDGSASQLVDLIGGLTLVAGGGEIPYGVISEGIHGISPLTGSGRTLEGSTSSAWDPIRIAGNLTLEVVCNPTQNTSQTHIVACGAAASVGATNRELYGLRRPYNTEGRCDVRYVHYNDASGELNYPSGTSRAVNEPYCTSTRYHYFAVVRDASAVTIRQYIDGVPWGANPYSYAGQAVTSGYSTSKLCLFRSEDQAESLYIVSSLRITAGCYTDAQVQEAWRQVRPL